MEIAVLSTDQIGSFIELIKVFEKVFEMQDFKMPGENQLQSLLDKEDFIVIVAIDNKKVVGGLTAYVLEQYYASRPLAYIYDLAVLSEYQRMGVGKKLMNYIKNYCQEKGFEEVFVQADRIDGHAVDFYRKTHPTAEEDVIHFYYRLDS